MTWARNYGDTHHGVGSTETKRAKRITKTCPDCGTGIPNIKKRCAPCFDVAMVASRAASSKRWYEKHKSSKTVQNGGGA